jgi:acyl-CoA thioesterase-1
MASYTDYTIRYNKWYHFPSSPISTFDDDSLNFLGIEPSIVRQSHRVMNDVLAELAKRYGTLVDLHTHFLTGDTSWYTQIIEPSLRGASEIRRCFLRQVLPHVRR